MQWYKISRAEPEDAAIKMGQLANASRSNEEGRLAQNKQDMQWGGWPRIIQLKKIDELRARHTRYLLAIKYKATFGGNWVLLN